MVFPEHGPGLACGGGCKTTGWCVTTPWSWSRPRAPASCKCLGMQLTKTFPHNIALNQHSSILAGVLNRLHHVHDQERASLALGMVKTWRRGHPPLIGRWVMLYCLEFIEFAICDQQLGHQIKQHQTTYCLFICKGGLERCIISVGDTRVSCFWMLSLYTQLYTNDYIFLCFKMLEPGGL